MITTAVFFPALKYNFISWDDTQYITENPYLQNQPLKHIGAAFTSLKFGLWMPLTWLSFGLDATLFGINPTAFHCTNMLWHCANVVIVYALFSLLFSNKIAGILALLWAIHPMRVESVVWISERKDVLASFFYLLALFLYIKTNLSNPVSQNQYRLTRAAITLCFIAAVMSKPMAITLPIIFILHLIIFKKKESKLWLSLLVIISVIISALTHYAHHMAQSLTDFTKIGLVMRMWNAFANITRYITHTLFPIHLSGFYPYEYHSWYDPSVLIGILITGLLLLTAWSSYQRAKNPWPAFFALFFLITLLPVLGFIQAGRHATGDRFLYLPCLGLLGLLGCLIKTQTKFFTPKRLTYYGLILASCLIIQTRIHMPYWQNAFIFWNSIVTRYDTGVAFAHNNLGLQYQQAGNNTVALYHYVAGLADNPKDPAVHINLGYLLEQKGFIRASVRAYEIAYYLRPDLPEAVFGLSKLYCRIGNVSAAETILTQFTKTNPNDNRAALILKKLRAKTRAQ